MLAIGPVPWDGQKHLWQRWQKEQQPGVRIWLLGYHGDPPLLGRQREKKCVHMPYNLQTATIGTQPVFRPFPLGIQTQLFSEITSSRSMEMWPSSAERLVIYILRQSLELLYIRACQYFHYKPRFRGTQPDCFKTPKQDFSNLVLYIFIKVSVTSILLQRL